MIEDDSQQVTPPDVEEQLPPHRIELAKSSRSKCRTCKRKIEKDVLRLGVMIVGPFGTGYLWHHLKCAAKRQFEDVEEAYKAEAWDEGVTVPDLESLKQLSEQTAKTTSEKKRPPYVERAPTGRSKCKHCDEVIEKDSWRVILGRAVEFGQQTRTGPINVHPGCVSDEIRAEDCATEIEGFEEAVKAGSSDLSAADFEQCFAAIGSLED